MAVEGGDKLKNQKDLVVGIVLICALPGIIIGIIIIMIKCGILSHVSSDGVLGLVGGLFGSLISGLVAFYILYINRKDAQKSIEENRKETEKIQHKNYQQTLSYMKQQVAIQQYKVNREICNDTMKLVAELMKLTEDYYIHVADNTYGYYLKKNVRVNEIYDLLEMELYGKDNAPELLQKIREYIQSFWKQRPTLKTREERPGEVDEKGRELKYLTKKFCNNILLIEDPALHDSKNKVNSIE
jgi:hypothetical protein|nr:MAG TPA: tail length tape measure protein [Caudoviricetes sp.]